MEGGWEIFFFREFKPKDGIQINKHNNLRASRLLNDFCIGIPIIQLHSIFHMWQIDFKMFIGLHIFFYITIKFILISAPQVGELVAIFSDFFIKVLFITL